MELDSKATKTQEFVYVLKVGQVMTQNVVSVPPGTAMSALREVLRSASISGVPVVDNGVLVGIVSLEDFIKWLADGKEDCPVADRMTRNVETVSQDAPIITVVEKFGRFGYGRFPVVDSTGEKVVGVITKADIIKGILRKLEGEYLQEELKLYRASHIFEDIVADRAVLQFQYDIRGKDFSRAGECASGLKKTLKRLGFHPQIVRRVAIAVYETEMNIIIYADEGTITAEVEPSRLVICAKDRGPGIDDVDRAMQPGYSTAPDWVREFGFGAGMGLPNIKRCSDRMDLTSEAGVGTELRIAIALKEVEGKA